LNILRKITAALKVYLKYTFNVYFKYTFSAAVIFLRILGLSIGVTSLL